MPSNAARKSPKSAPPTWSRIDGGKAHQPKSRSSAPRGGGKPAANGPRPFNQSGYAHRPSRPSRPPIEIPAHLRREMAALVLLVLGALSGVGLYAWAGGGKGALTVAGGVLAELFGVVAWVVPLALAAAALLLLVGARAGARWASPLVPVGLCLMLLGTMGFLHLFANGQPAADAGQGGGYVGLAISTVLSDYLTKVGAGVVLLAITTLGFMLTFNVSLGQLVRGVGRPTVAAWRMAGSALGATGREISALLKGGGRPGGTLQRGPVRINGAIADDAEELEADEDEDSLAHVEAAASAAREPEPREVETQVVHIPTSEPAPAAVAGKPDVAINRTRPKGSPADSRDTAPQIQTESPLGYLWTLPALTLLETTGELKVSQTDIKSKIKVIEETLQSFNVEATVREVNTGPAVTQFAIEPGTGVRVSRVTALDKDLALALAAPDIRIEAPIPGQSRIGIEVPNASLQVVGLRSIMESEVYAGSKARLKVCLGRDTHGHPVVTDLAKLPHLLVAGATGSGKSVFLNSMIVNFLLQFTPDDLRMLMIDPKRVELTGFNGIPHLLRPVVTDVRMDKDPQVKARNANGTSADRERPLTAVEALKWALWEMERRYKTFAKGQKGKDGISKVFRNIEQYRTFMRENPELKMEHIPYIVIIIDELADLMLTAPEEVETSLCRLAQLARATGIHLVVATQRPSVDVVTGLIKANFPARAAFAVTSQVDSKVIIDGSGAEKLLGRGDMLYTASDESKPVRIQGTFVSDAESERVVNFWRKQLPSLDDGAGEKSPEAQGVVQPMPMPDWLGTGDPNEDTELLEQAIELVKRNRYVSVSMLQRKLRVGYNRAARMVEQMEEMGLISPANGENKGKPREVLLGAPDERGLVPDEVEEELP